MNKLLVLASFCAFFVVVCGKSQYTTKYDNVNLDDIIKSDRLMQNYVNCLLDKGRCTPDGAELKRVLPDALKNGCTECNQKQKDGSAKVIRHLIQNKKDWWGQLEKKYDPSGSYKKKYEAELKKTQQKQ